jgi:hypothetical protein
VNKKISSSILILILLLTACNGGQYVWRSDPPLPSYNNRYFSISTVPIILFDGYGAFAIKVKNKTKRKIEVDWNRTIFISNAKANGGFMFEGIPYEKRNYPIPPDIIPPHRTLRKIVFPNNLIVKSDDSWIHKPMEEGENGLYITVRVNGKNMGAILTSHLSEKRERDKEASSSF